MADLSKKVWLDARSDKEADLRSLLQTVHLAGGGESVERLKASFEALDRSFEKRETDRAKKIAEVEEKLDQELAKPNDPKALSEALKYAVERYLVSKRDDRANFMVDGRITKLIQDADAAAHAAEAVSDWFLANELFVRLHLLLEERGTYKADVRRIGDRLAMIRLYTPERFWKLRNDERLEEGKTPLPPYNGLGEDYRERLQGVEATTVAQAVFQASRQQIDRVPLKDILTAGIDSLRTMITTTDIQGAFPGLQDESARRSMLAFLDARAEAIGKMEQEPAAPRQTLKGLMEEVVDINSTTVKVLNQALLHEFGNGCMSRMDEFSAIIWPDELERFRRMTEGQFKGVGVQIQLDEESQKIKVVTPLEGTPAQRAGIKAGDLIVKINGQSAVGISLNQAVDLITGPENTDVTVTVERTVKGAEGQEDTVTEIEFPLKRAVIPVATVKGWKRLGAAEDQWEWFIDRPSRIGYVRLLQFTDETTKELHAALDAMKRDGLNGLILDLRFNPGGLLNEAVTVANTFIQDGLIVSTKGTVPGEERKAMRQGQQVRGVPVVVLINEGSASASEIVSGAIRHYADKGDIDAILIGERSFGKGSVQNVWPLSPNTMMKLTTQYYYLPDGRTIHRKPGESQWGVDPHLTVQMLPDQVSEALKVRQDADVLTINEKGEVVEGAEPRPEPEKLLTESIDLQLQTALVILQTKTAAGDPGETRVSN